jgi:hypothetical protein
MAKRATSGEGPFRPLLDMGIISAVVNTPIVALDTEATKTVGIQRPLVNVAQPQVPTGPASFLSQSVPLALVAAGEKFDQEKRMLLTRSESLSLERLVNSLATRLNCQLKASHVLRALVALLLNAEGEVDRRAREAGSLERPANGNAKAMEMFERKLARIFSDSIRDAGPMRP